MGTTGMDAPALPDPLEAEGRPLAGTGGGGGLFGRRDGPAPVPVPEEALWTEVAGVKAELGRKEEDEADAEVEDDAVDGAW